MKKETDLFVAGSGFPVDVQARLAAFDGLLTACKSYLATWDEENDCEDCCDEEAVCPAHVQAEEAYEHSPEIQMLVRAIAKAEQECQRAGGEIREEKTNV